ncbi:hypothetical protein [Paracoccus siganidrum]|uniref:Heme peroxidase n=1 Tax=Paracoccus siganidrum TaxID=1276757 RepID=A0A419AAC2_9RHOB|nr:hypothetical protein [Paracoccus siganidrum]RJL19693.1 hypothetical protein D3P05_04545 [Paracoccus siganidrum]RMC35924.1 hypothetical protein C9E82_10605 [Paracoccus siganidrum]
MPQTTATRRFAPVCRFGCSPGPIDTALPVAVNGADAGGNAAVQPSAADIRVEGARQMPEILLRTTPAWRRACLAEVSHVPAGYTYLGQLMGHDIGSSVTQDSVPHVTRGNATGAAALLGEHHYNLIDNPLTLETVYGPGPMMLSHLYDPGTMLFRLTPGARLARVYGRGAGRDPDPVPFRALYDERNRDTLMLHELAVAWMQFHNLCARRLMAGGMPPFAAYVATRGHAVRVWHGIIRTDVLPRFLHPRIAALPEEALADEWHLDEATLLQGLFRAFHAMPLAAYQLGRSGLHNLSALLKTGFGPSEAETDWHVDWPLFFGQRPGGPISGLSASVAPELRAPVSAAAVIQMDDQTEIQAKPLRLGNDELRAALARLPDDWPRQLRPEAMARDFAARYPDAPVRLTGPVIEWGPLFQALMVEAQLHGQAGGFGPLGSALLRRSITESMRRVRLAPEPEAARALPVPATMLELINLVREGV